MYIVQPEIWDCGMVAFNIHIGFSQGLWGVFFKFLFLVSKAIAYVAGLSCWLSEAL